MRRRDVMAGLVTAPAVWSVHAFAQPAERVRRIGILVSAPTDEPEYIGLLKSFRERLAELGWTEGRNLRVELRWGGGGQAHVQTGGDLVLARVVGTRPPPARRGPGSVSAGRRRPSSCDAPPSGTGPHPVR